ncbi:MAG: RraA family protein [Alphaproteobacteria bacterium]|nr:RraA family protein [Alphaproteobacteria bacterium]
MALWQSDEELFQLLRSQLSTCPVSDVMEQLGFLYPMLPHQIKPLRSDMVLVGRAMPVQDDPPIPHGAPKRFDSKPFGLLFDSIEDLRPGEVYIATGAPVHAARLGDMLITRAKALGAAGMVINGNVRDANGIVDLDIPVFSHGSYAYGLQGRHNVVDYRCSIVVGKTRVRPGDLIFGDNDGVCAIPREAEEEIITRAIEKNDLEQKVRRAIENGESVVDAFKKFSVM